MFIRHVSCSVGMLNRPKPPKVVCSFLRPFVTVQATLRIWASCNRTLGLRSLCLWCHWSWFPARIRDLARVGACMPPMPGGKAGVCLSFCLSTLRLSLVCAWNDLHFLLLASCGYPKFSWTLSHTWCYSWIHLDLWWTVCAAPSLHTATPCPCTYSQASTRNIFLVREPHLLCWGGSSNDVKRLGFDAIGHLGQEVCPSTCRDMYYPQSAPIVWIISSVMGSKRSAPSSRCLKTFTKTALSWIHKGGAALFPWPRPIIQGWWLAPPKYVLDSLKPVLWKNLLFVGIVAPWPWLVCCHLSELTILTTLSCDWPCHSNRLRRPRLLSLAVWLVKINPPSGFCQTLHPQPHFLSSWKVLLGCNRCLWAFALPVYQRWISCSSWNPPRTTVWHRVSPLDIPLQSSQASPVILRSSFLVVFRSKLWQSIVGQAPWC